MGVIVAAGMMGGLALMLAQMTKQQHQSQKKAETGVEVVALSQRIVRTLYDGDACMQTLGSGNAIRPNTPLSVNAIKNKNGRDIVVAGTTYGNRLLKISSIKVVEPVVSGNTAEAKLEVVMERTSRAYTGEKTVTKNFDLTLNLDTSANPPTLVGCATGGGELIVMCKALGGTWGGGKCSLPAPAAPILPDLSCPAGEFLTGILAGAAQCGKPSQGGTSKLGPGGKCFTWYRTDCYGPSFSASQYSNSGKASVCGTIGWKAKVKSKTGCGLKEYSYCGPHKSCSYYTRWTTVYECCPS